MKAESTRDVVAFPFFPHVISAIIVSLSCFLNSRFGSFVHPFCLYWSIGKLWLDVALIIFLFCLSKYRWFSCLHFSLPCLTSAPIFLFHVYILTNLHPPLIISIRQPTYLPHSHLDVPST